MNELAQHALSVFLGFFAIMNPLANTAVFVGLTGSESRSSQAKIASRALFLTFVIIVIFCVLGNAIFHLFGLTLPALRITGGILLFLIGYQMLHGESAKMHQPVEAENKKATADIAVSPLAVPILAGPGTIATAMNYSATGDITEIVITIITFTVLCLITFFCFISGQRLVALIGSSGINIITRLMGLILAVMGTQMALTGITSQMATLS